MLAHQKGGWHQHGNLFAVLNGLERGAHGNLGLAITDVAGKQAIHRNFTFHVALDLVDGGQLVNGFDKAESLFQLALPRGVWAKGVTAALHAGTVKLDQVDGNGANRLASTALDG